MPATSEAPQKLADELFQIGEILGYESEKEAPVSEGSKLRVDVLWKASGVFEVAAIEIQYSDSLASISHNMLKSEHTLHPNMHLVISYNRLSDDYKKNLALNDGVAIFEGQNDIDRINRWISRVLDEKDRGKQVELGKQFVQFLKNRKIVNVEKEKLQRELLLERLFEPVIFEITVWAREGSGERGHTFFVTGSTEKAKATALKYFEERFSDVPFELDGQYLELDRVEITCYQLVGQVAAQPEKQGRTAFKVVMDGRIGREDDYFEFTDFGFGLDPKEVESNLVERIAEDIERLKHFQHKIIDKQVYFGKYSRITNWTEKVRGKILMATKTIPSKEEQEQMLNDFFYKEFGLNVSDLLSLHDIDSRCRYSENLDYIKRQLRDLFKQDIEAFRYRMHEDDIRRLAEWLGVW